MKIKIEKERISQSYNDENSKIMVNNSIQPESMNVLEKTLRRVVEVQDIQGK